MGDTLTTMDRLGFPDWTCIALSGLAIAVSHGTQGFAVGQAPRSTLGSAPVVPLSGTPQQASGVAERRYVCSPGWSERR